ncbi:MAG: hypothetical protein MJZ32_02870 [Bacteroidaceae bacterium]|nr:hypothetical protein [Bacteroidaceae bacterium]
MKQIHKWILRLSNASMWVGAISFIGYKLTDSSVFYSLLLISSPVFIACGIYSIIREIIIARSIKAVIKKFWLELFYLLIIVIMMATIVIGVSLS